MKVKQAEEQQQEKEANHAKSSTITKQRERKIADDAYTYIYNLSDWTSRTKNLRKKSLKIIVY